MTHTDKPHMTLPNGEKLFEGHYGVTRGGDVVGPMALGRDANKTGYPWTIKGSHAVGRWSNEGEDGESVLMGPDESDIIAKHHPAATPEVGTLSELNVQPGDVVECVSWKGDIFRPGKTAKVGYEAHDVHPQDGGTWRIISRAAAPLPYGHARLPSGEVVDLTAITAPFGLLPADVQQALRAHGGPYEAWQVEGYWEAMTPGWGLAVTYRVKPQPPAPKVEEVVLYGFMNRMGVYFDKEEDMGDTHRITLTLRDGVPDPVAKVESL